MNTLLQIQTALKAPKSQRNTFGNYNYRSAEDILEAVKPLLDKYDATLTLSDEIVEVGGRIYVKATAHFEAEDPDDPTRGTIKRVTAYAREAEAKKGMDDCQITGTASSYARKYALNGLFLIDDTKDVDTDEYNEQTSKAPKKDQAAKAEKEPPKWADLEERDAAIADITLRLKLAGKTVDAFIKHLNIEGLQYMTKAQYEEWAHKLEVTTV